MSNICLPAQGFHSLCNLRRPVFGGQPVNRIRDGGRAESASSWGIPFSDPTAEGPVIQEANVRALSAGTTTDKIFAGAPHSTKDRHSDGVR